MKPKIICIVGPTATGKTSVAISLAQDFGGEVVSADSRQVYRGLDLGSGKVTESEMRGIPHHLLSIADPQEVYTADTWHKDATRHIESILSRHKLPIICGGTGLYFDLLLGTQTTSEVPRNETLRKKLEEKSIEALRLELQKKDPRRYSTIDTHNKVRLIRALEIVETLGEVPASIATENPYDVYIVYLDLPTAELEQNIQTRLLERIDLGMIKEVEGLLADGVSRERLHDLGLEYRYTALYLDGIYTREEYIRTLSTKILQYAKRQRTWWKRYGHLHTYRKDQYKKIQSDVSTFLKTA